MPRKLKCFILMIGDGFYRPEGKILTIHGVGHGHARKLLKKSGRINTRKPIWLCENHHCDPQSGEPCYYKLLIQPSYGIAPEIEMLPNSPEWNERFGPDAKTDMSKISQRRQDIIDGIKKRKDIYD